MIKNLTTKEVIESFNEIHGDKYGYSKVNYINNKSKVNIICSEHGEFEQEPSNHKRGQGCPKCAINGKTSNTVNFIKNIKNIHEIKYNYSKVNYINSKIKVIIICPKHGEFNQTPTNHLNGKGCPKCASKYLSTKEVITEFENVHGEKYNYSKFDYVGTLTKSIIICPKHGEFNQTPSKHKNGRGCPICKESKGERSVRLFLDENNIIHTLQYKFNGCKDKRKLPFDFYLPEFNMCIEYDGIQHFKPKSLFGGENGLKDRQRKDKIKTDYCTNNGINLLRIRYDEDVNDILNQYFI